MKSEPLLKEIIVAIMTIAINDPSLEHRASEVAFIKRAIEEVLKEFGRGQGTVTSGSIVGMSSTGVANTSLGSWTYTPSASLP
jgi:hypothetical protein